MQIMLSSGNFADMYYAHRRHTLLIARLVYNRGVVSLQR